MTYFDSVFCFDEKNKAEIRIKPCEIVKNK